VNGLKRFALVLGSLQVLGQRIVLLGRLVLENRHNLALLVHHEIATRESTRRLKRSLVPHLATRPHQIGVCFAFDVIHAIALTIGTVDHLYIQSREKSGQPLAGFAKDG